MQDDTTGTVALIESALRGERRASRRLVEELTPAIRGSVAKTLLAARRRMPAKGEVDDITQTIFLALFVDGGRLLLRWDPARGLGLRGFVAMVARRRTVALLRSRRRNPWSEEPVDVEALDEHPAATGEPEATALQREALAAVTERMRARLSRRGAELFEILFLDARSTEDACSLTGLSPNAVHCWKSRMVGLAREMAAELAG